jgi:hypothetical protein
MPKMAFARPRDRARTVATFKIEARRVVVTGFRNSLQKAWS